MNTIKSFLFFAGSIFLFCTAQAQTRYVDVCTIAFYNLENLFDPDDDPRIFGDDDFLPNGKYRYDREKYQHKLRHLAEVIRKLGTPDLSRPPVLIGVTEVENRKVLSDLCVQDPIKDFQYRFVHFDSRDRRGIDVALLYDPSYFRLLSARSVSVDISHSDQKGGRTRDVLFVSGLLGGDTLFLLVNHWPSRWGGVRVTDPLRAIAAATNKRIMDSLFVVNPKASIILMGDFNDPPNSRSVMKVLGAKDTIQVEDVDGTGVYNPFFAMSRDGVGTTAYRDRWSLFDQIIISRSLYQPENDNSWRFYRAEVFNRKFLQIRAGRFQGYPHRTFRRGKWLNGYSDHFPILVYLIRLRSENGFR